MFIRLLFTVFLAISLVGSASGQTSVAARAPDVADLVSRALQSLAGSTALTDITIEATAHSIFGSSDETGTAILVARGNAESTFTLNLTSGQRREIRRGPAGVWTGPDGTTHRTATHNCFLEASWFFPAFSLAALNSDATLVMTLVGQEVYAGQPVYHLVLFHAVPKQRPNVTALIQRVSTMHLYLDANSLMPAAIIFNSHPDRDANTDIPTEVRFGTYQSFHGVWVPSRIQKFMQNSLVLDLSVTNVAVNSGIPDGFFALPSVPEGGAQ